MNSNYLKGLKVVYFVLAMGLILFVLVAFFIINMNGSLAKEAISPAQRAPFLIALILITGAAFMTYKAIFTKKLDLVKTLPTLDKKLAAWRELCVLQGALIEAPSFFAIVLFMLLGNYILLIWPVVSISLLWMRQPTRDLLISETNLSPAEAAEFDALS